MEPVVSCKLCKQELPKSEAVRRNWKEHEYDNEWEHDDTKTWNHKESKYTFQPRCITKLIKKGRYQ